MTRGSLRRPAVAPVQGRGGAAGTWIPVRPERQLQQMNQGRRKEDRVGGGERQKMFEHTTDSDDSDPGTGSAAARGADKEGREKGGVGRGAERGSGFGSVSIAGIPRQAQRLKVDDVLAQANFNLTASESDSQDDNKYDFSR